VAEEPWEAFFDTHYVLTYAPLQPDDHSRADALAAARLAGVPAGASILDVPCGYGRHAVALAVEGYHVVGLDRSPTQLDEARRRRGSATEPRLVRADYRQIPLAGGTFDGALVLHSSLGYTGADADQAVLREIRRVLRPGGRLVIETNHRDRLPPRSPRREWYPLGNDAFLLEESRVDRVAGTVELTHTYLRASGQPQTRTILWRAYSVTELAGMLRDSGFGEVVLREPRRGAVRGRHAPRPRRDGTSRISTMRARRVSGSGARSVPLALGPLLRWIAYANSIVEE
jgi:SAM-dependent methyltransferase